MNKEGRPSQKQLILSHLQRFGSIEPLTALREYGCYRLGARIADLKDDGHVIRTTIVKSRSRITGNIVRFAKYVLEKTDNSQSPLSIGANN